MESNTMIILGYITSLLISILIFAVTNNMFTDQRDDEDDDIK